MKLAINKHSVYLLRDQLVLVVTYRRQVFDEKISNYAKDAFVRIGEPYNMILEEWNHDKDHVHVMFKAHSNTE